MIARGEKKMKRSIDPVIQNLRDLALRMGTRAESILDKALRAAFDKDTALATEVAADDIEIDRLDVEIDTEVLKALALQAPVALDLREVIGIKMMATDLERVGDIARNIAKSAIRLTDGASDIVPELAVLARDSQQILRQALDAFSQRDVAAARAVIEADDRIDDEQDRIVAEAVGGIPAHPERASLAVDEIFIAKNLERVADHATNIAEDVILVAEARNVKHAEKLAG